MNAKTQNTRPTITYLASEAVVGSTPMRLWSGVEAGAWEQEESVRLEQEVLEARQLLEGVIVMPLIGSIDAMRARGVARNLLAGIREHRARVVIPDITSVPIVDSGVAADLNKTIQAARLKGARTIVDLGIDWNGIETLSDLRSGLRAALGSPHALQELRHEWI
jgi:rsbT co-antagonist protein RsbR